MSLLLAFALFCLGFVLVVYGADWLVDGASALARRFGVSELVVGLTVVAFGTSAPELVVNVVSSIKGASGIVYGNIIGFQYHKYWAYSWDCRDYSALACQPGLIA